MNRIRAAIAIFRARGVGGVLIRLGERMSPKTPSLVRPEDALAVDWRHAHPAVANPRAVDPGALTIAWIISPPGTESGGHQNIYRFISYLEKAGHRVRIYLYSASLDVSAQAARDRTAASASFPDVAASVEQYSDAGVASDVDAIFATGWETAYASFRDSSPARRLYFVQDFEPFFYPVGTESVLAENTYHFGFTAITAGGWLASKLRDSYGMATAFYEFGAERRNYHVTNDGPRKEVFFYARPGTARRGFELGIMALTLFAEARPEYTINLAGWDVSQFPIPFEYNNLKSMPITQLNDVYNRCAVGLVLSMTNMSLLPLELLASGVIPVVNDGDNNSMVSNNPFIEYTEPSPRALADRLIAVVDRPDLPTHARAGSDSLREQGWDAAGAQFLAAFEGVMRG